MKLIKVGRFYWVDYTANGKRHRQSTGATSRSVAEVWMKNIQVARKMPTFESAVEVLRHLFDRPAPGAIPLDAIHDTYMRLARAVGRDL